MFTRANNLGETRHKQAVIDCSDDIILVEQSHVKEVDINAIIKRHGIDLITKTANLNTAEYRFDDVTGNDFQEALFKIKKAESTFQSLPSELRNQFENNPAKFLDFVQNPENADQMVEMGIASKIEPEIPLQVEVVNSTPSTPPITETPPE